MHRSKLFNTLPFILMKNNFIIIAGPCSVETEEQIYNTAKQLKELVNPSYFRAALWKPRTRPGNFEGIGTKGLSWITTIQQELNMNVITEVGNPKHVETILKNQIKAYWLGARTVSNPFSVQEIIEATDNKNINIFIKNPLFPDVELWAGVIERYFNAGFNNVFAVHRGFFPYQKTYLRNIPMWEVPIELARRYPQLKIICDPSHIAGNPDFIKEISQQAINLNMNGLMVEVHHNPQIALSDKNQQITPIQLKNILSELKFKSNNTSNPDYDEIIQNLRQEIDKIDYKLIDELAKRFIISDKIGELKRIHNTTILQLDRWKSILETRIQHSQSHNISKDFILKIFEQIHEESINRQNKIQSNTFSD